MLVSVFATLAAVITLWWRLRQREVDEARRWPQTEATIESGEVELVSSLDGMELPVFAFSYQVERAYYSGRFALRPYRTDPGESPFARMAGRKLRVHYDPNRPGTWFLPDELIEGCKVEQKIGLPLNTYSPK
jgi:hypothetical protein